MQVIYDLVYLECEATHIVNIPLWEWPKSLNNI